MKRYRLFNRIFFSFFFLIALFVFGTGVYVVETARRHLMGHARAELRKTAALIADRFPPDFVVADPAAVNRRLKNLGDTLGRRIRLVGPDGAVIGEAGPPPGRENISIRLPIRFLRRGTAYLTVFADTSAFQETLSSLRRRIAVGGAVVICLSIALAAVVRRRLMDPLRRMQTGVRRFAEGDLKYRMPIPLAEELRDTVEAMNRMAVLLDERYRTLIRQRNELETLLSSMVEGLVALDLDERIQRVNPAACRMFQTTPEALVGRTIQEGIRVSGLHKLLSQTGAEGKPVAGDIKLYRNTERILHTHLTPLQNDGDKSDGILMVFHDVTRLRHLENMRREFVANVSHELKTPLTAIKGFVETLRYGDRSDAAENDRFLGIIEKHVNRLEAIIGDLMNLSQVEQKSRTQKIDLSPDEILPVAETALQLCRAKANEKNIRLTLQCDPAIRAEINPLFLEQALVNLLDNAVKYSPEKSVVAVEISENATEVVIAVADEGIGISREHLPRLFERFYRVDKARSRKLGGTGLGLSIVKHIVQSHKGRISVESTPGKGSVFIIRLPALVSDLSPPLTASSPADIG